MKDRRPMRYGIVGLGFAVLAVSEVPVGAQSRGTSAADAVAAGRFRGTVAEPDPAHVGRHVMRPVTGTARWRSELDSLDWREKLTVRVTLDAPERGVFVARAAGPGVAHGATIVASRGGQAYVPATIAELLPVPGTARWEERQTTFGDSVVLDAARGLDRSVVLRGRLVIGGYPRTSRVLRPDDMQRTVSVSGAFAATFDPRVRLRPRTMSDSLQRAILERALGDAGAHWLDGKVHIRANDSSFSNVLLRGYLASRWSHVATIDSVRTDYTRLYLRMRGRYAPVVCENDDGRVRCSPVRK